jgi:hypothetical protein
MQRKQAEVEGYDKVPQGFSRRRGSQGRVFGTGNEGIHRVHSGNPAFRRPSISSFASASDPRSYCKCGIKLKHTRRRLTSLSVAPEMGERRCETAVSWRKRGLLTLVFLPCDDGLVEATYGGE